ncbi:hypothetical protein [Streptomyces hokutonensis]|uniref:hypothetical protein n=1 Tax=Streptomyces hokutonensis TaxID=1306990 RepID=UPI00369CA363
MDAIRGVDSVELVDVVYVVRHPDRAREQLPPRATSARTPLFDSAHLTDGTAR